VRGVYLQICSRCRLEAAGGLFVCYELQVSEVRRPKTGEERERELTKLRRVLQACMWWYCWST
jgi:hypothetical protein